MVILLHENAFSVRKKLAKKPSNNEDKNEFAAFPVVRFSTGEKSENWECNQNGRAKFTPPRLGFGCHIDATRWLMALNFESFVIS